LRCHHGRCAGMYTESFVNFRNNLLNMGASSHPMKVYLSEGLVLIKDKTGVGLWWTYASIAPENDPRHQASQNVSGNVDVADVTTGTSVPEMDKTSLET
jgi:hypothetical protein